MITLRARSAVASVFSIRTVALPLYIFVGLFESVRKLFFGTPAKLLLGTPASPAGVRKRRSGIWQQCSFGAPQDSAGQPAHRRTGLSVGHPPIDPFGLEARRHFPGDERRIRGNRF